MRQQCVTSKGLGQGLAFGTVAKVLLCAGLAMGQTPPPACSPRWLEGFGRPGLPQELVSPAWQAVLALPNGDVLFGGRATRERDLTLRGSLQRWDGTSMTTEVVTTEFLSDVFGLSRKGDRVYAIGTISNGPMRVYRLQGGAWSQVGPDIAGFGVINGAVEEMSDGSIWISGFILNQAFVGERPAVLRLVDGQWQAPAAGLFGFVSTLVELPTGEVVAGGSVQINGGPQWHVAVKFDGQTWSPMDPGLETNANRLEAMEELRLTEDGRLFGAGLLNPAQNPGFWGVAEFDGQVWRQVGRSTMSPIFYSVGLSVFGDRELALGGDFGQFFPVNSRYLALHNLRSTVWNPIPTNAVAAMANTSNARGIFAMDHDPIGRLAIAGSFSGGTPAGSSVRNVYLLDGQRVDPLGFDSPILVAATQFFSSSLQLNATMDERGTKYLWNPGRGMARLDVLNRREFVEDPDIWPQQVLAFPSGELFGVVTQRVTPPGGPVQSTIGLARLFNGRWERFNQTASSGFLTNVGGSGNGYLTRPNGDLLLAYRSEARAFQLSNVPADRIVRWTGTEFVDAVPQQLPSVIDVANSPNGNLIAGGSFSTTINSRLIANIAQWDGTQWSPVGNDPTGASVNGPVSSLNPDPMGNLVVLGSFTRVDGLDLPGQAIWNGSAWRAFAGPSGGLNGPVSQVLRTHGGKLLLRGSFTQAGSHTVPGLALWNGADFEPWAGGPIDAGLVLAREDNGDIVISRNLQNFVVAGQTFRGRARFDGQTWIADLPPATGSSTSGSVSRSGRLRDGTLWFTGSFDSIDGVNSFGVAFFGVPKPVTITQQPSVATVCSNADGVFEVATAGQGPIRHQWQIKWRGGADFVNLVDGIVQVPGGGQVRVRGAEMFKLRVEPVNSLSNLPGGELGEVRVIVRNACATVTSEPRALTSLARCGAADIAGAGAAELSCGDGVLDSNDFVLFIQWFFAGDARADFGGQGAQPVIREPIGDGTLDNNDFVVFINLFFEGCGQ
jgi:trimeric autotransporter adhesin